MSDRQRGYRFRNGRPDRSDLLDGAKSGRVQHIGPDLLECLQTSDRVVEIRMIADVVLGARRQGERKFEPTCRLGGRGDPLGGVMQVVEATGGIIVLDRSTDGTNIGNAPDRDRRTLRIGAVAVLQVNRNRQIRRLVDGGDVPDHLIQRRLAVETAEGERETRACRRQRLESKRRQYAGRSDIPWIRNDERRAGVQGAKIESLLALSVHCRQVYWRRICGACGGEIATGVMRTSCP